MYKDLCGVVGRLIWYAKKNYYERILNELPSNQSKLFNFSRRLFGLNNHECANHNLSVNANVSEVFSKFFSEKINNVRTTLNRINQDSNTIDALYCDKRFAALPLRKFLSATIEEVEAIIRRSSSKSCDLDPLPTALLKLCLPELFATLLSIINHAVGLVALILVVLINSLCYFSISLNIISGGFIFLQIVLHLRNL